MSATLHTTADGERVLLLAGSVDGEADKRVASRIRQKQYSQVWLCSGGGSVEAGKEIGRALSRAKATVRVPNGFFCASACTIAHLGGYNRIIDPQANFIIHASSAYKGMGLSDFIILNCAGGTADALCGAFMSDLRSQNFAECRSMTMLQDPLADCFYLLAGGRGDGFRQMALSARYLPRLPASETVLTALIDRLTARQISYVADLLEYYQEMLLDGRRDLIDRNGYYTVRQGLNPQPLYNATRPGPYSRMLKEDVAAMNAAGNVADRLALWQLILTDMELNVQRQLVDFVQSGQADLGAAGLDAVKIFDAMIICQIQSSCYLEQHQAEALGFRNFFDVQ